MRRVVIVLGILLAVVATLYVAGVAYVKMVEREVFRITRARRSRRFGR